MHANSYMHLSIFLSIHPYLSDNNNKQKKAMLSEESNGRLNGVRVNE